MDRLPFSKRFIILLLITTYCESQPSKLNTENPDDIFTTLCPEELARRKLEENLDKPFEETVNLQQENLPSKIEDENDSKRIIEAPEENFDGTTTVCPDELEKNNLKEDSSEDLQEKQEDLQKKVNSEETTTPCPGEQEKDQNAKNSNSNLPETQSNPKDELESVNIVQNEENISQTHKENFEETTTLCPEELEKRRLEEKSNIAINYVNEDAGQNNEESVQKETTICPEELEKRKLEQVGENLDQNEQKIQDNLLEVTDSLKSIENEKSDSQRLTEKGDSRETTTLCPEELEKRKQVGMEKNLDQSEQKIQDNLTDVTDTLTSIKNEETDSQRLTERGESGETTTICPEELERRKQAEIEKNLNQSEQKTQDNLLEVADNLESVKNEENDGQILTEGDNAEAATTICSEELKRKQSEIEQNLNEVTEKTSNTVQTNNEEGWYKETSDDSHIRKKLEQSQEYLIKYKELVNKVQKFKHSKTKRQATDYSSYYPNQASYNSQEVADLNTGTNKQQPSSYTPDSYSSQGLATSNGNQDQQSYNSQGYNSQNYNVQGYTQQSYNPQGGLSSPNNNVKTYQQIRQYQTGQKYQKPGNFYPKTYRNNMKKPVKIYRNPSTHVRYPSNGNFKNYYRLNNIGSRRQFQGTRQFASTSARPVVRVTRKKKFKPSPVFA